MKRDKSTKTLIYVFHRAEIQWKKMSLCKRLASTLWYLISFMKICALPAYILFIVLCTCLYYIIQPQFFPTFLITIRKYLCFNCLYDIFRRKCSFASLESWNSRSLCCQISLVRFVLEYFLHVLTIFPNPYVSVFTDHFSCASDLILMFSNYKHCFDRPNFLEVVRTHLPQGSICHSILNHTNSLQNKISTISKL